MNLYGIPGRTKEYDEVLKRLEKSREIRKNPKRKMPMCNTTLAEDDYKEAVRNKYEKEKDGIYSNYLSNPSQANLRELCWKIFKSDKPTIDDLSVYNDFFNFEFDSNNDDTSISYTDKFRKVGKFLRGETTPAKIDTVNLAAVLVGFELRPYTKFKKLALVQAGKDADNKSEEILSNLKTEFKSEIEDLREEKNDQEKKLYTKDEVFKDIDFLKEEKVSVEPEIPKQNIEAINLFLDTDKSSTLKDCEKKKKGNVKTFVAISAGICLLILISYYLLHKKECMQWSNDHYDLVDCDFKANEIGIPQPIEILDESVVNIKKIKVCDTTIFFDKNHKAIIWYAKTANGIDFFNSHGIHPENGNTLRPVTKYIIDKYVKVNTTKK